jgi:predicted DCC family thiol-disulfide oxidoreductase YuxK
MRKWWQRLFLEERPSISLSLFRIVAALTTASVVVPSLVHLKELYFQGSFRELNPGFFPVWFLELVQRSPDGLVMVFAAVFYFSTFTLLIGLFSQLSCILMTLSCYFFYALNAYHVSTLSWDILLVTLVMMCVTGYHGDYFSVDCLLGKEERPWTKRRPFFVQRLLQMQLAFTFFYTALYKTTVQGNWLTDNPLYYVLHYPSPGVTKMFLLRDFVQGLPGFIYGVGVMIVVAEYLIIFFLFWPPTRMSAIYLGIFFQLLLFLTLDVPATFVFLFPAMFLLFINPQDILEWIEGRRNYHRAAPRPKLLYDGNCGFCQRCIRILKKMDLFDTLHYENFHESITANTTIPAGLTKEQVLKRIYLVENGKNTWGGYSVFRRICWQMPMMMPLIPVIFFPGMGLLGPLMYAFVAKNRMCLGRGKESSCRIPTD